MGPLGSFTCIIGPNGSGKSVVVGASMCLPQVCTARQKVAEAVTMLLQGEAVAFVLGAGTAVLRTKKGSALINTSLQLHSGANAEAKASLEASSFLQGSSYLASNKSGPTGDSALSSRRW